MVVIVRLIWLLRIIGAHIHGALAAVEEPSTASIREIAALFE
jgi:hypothetical protein